MPDIISKIDWTAVIKQRIDTLGLGKNYLVQDTEDTITIIPNNIDYKSYNEKAIADTQAKAAAIADIAPIKEKYTPEDLERIIAKYTTADLALIKAKAAASANLELIRNELQKILKTPIYMETQPIETKDIPPSNRDMPCIEIKKKYLLNNLKPGIDVQGNIILTTQEPRNNANNNKESKTLDATEQEQSTSSDSKPSSYFDYFLSIVTSPYTLLIDFFQWRYRIQEARLNAIIIEEANKILPYLSRQTNSAHGKLLDMIPKKVKKLHDGAFKNEYIIIQEYFSRQFRALDLKFLRIVVGGGSNTEVLKVIINFRNFIAEASILIEKIKNDETLETASIDAKKAFAKLTQAIDKKVKKLKNREFKDEYISILQDYSTQHSNLYLAYNRISLSENIDSNGVTELLKSFRDFIENVSKENKKIENGEIEKRINDEAIKAFSIVPLAQFNQYKLTQGRTATIQDQCPIRSDHAELHNVCPLNSTMLLKCT